MKISLSAVNYRSLKAQIIKKSEGAVTARVLKKALYIRGAEQEHRVEKAYGAALHDLVGILNHKSRLPSSVRTTGTKRIAIRPYGRPSRTVLTPSYKKLSKRTLAAYPTSRYGKKSYWYGSGWYAKAMSQRLLGTGNNWTLRNVQFEGIIGVGKKMRMNAKISAPSLYSSVLNKLIMDPFLHPNSIVDTNLKSTLDAGTNVVGRSVYLEGHRPLLSVVMQKHGQEAWRYLKADIL